MIKKTICTVLLVISSLFAVVTFAEDMNTPASKEAIDACKDKKEGDVCSFTHNGSKKDGTCQKGHDKADKNKVACMEKAP